MQEIEKKYLVDSIPSVSNFKFYEIIQAYLSFEPEIRIRKKNDEFFLTQKGSGSLIRKEIETKINEISYSILFSLIQSKIINKTRIEIPLSKNIIAELDIYHDELEGLVTVEVEFASEDQANNFNKPDWFGKEITVNDKYKNKNLANATQKEIKKLITDSQTM